MSRGEARGILKLQGMGIGPRGWLTFALEEALDDICKPGREDQGGDAMGGEKLRDE